MRFGFLIADLIIIAIVAISLYTAYVAGKEQGEKEVQKKDDKK